LTLLLRVLAEPFFALLRLFSSDWPKSTASSSFFNTFKPLAEELSTLRISTGAIFWSSSFSFFWR
tara:strand:- start:579 stop:773 length:195 start_codon:yes stop_codon:yes gene_type:complete